MKEIPKIIENSFLRKAKILKLALGTTTSYFKNRKVDLEDKIQGILEDQSANLVTQLGMMKGPIMKMGQVLSLYGDHLLPPEFKKILSQLESKSFYLKWEQIKKDIPSHYFEEIEIEPTPLAAASLGQVHRGKILKTGEDVVLKIQYPEVDRAIVHDLGILKLILKVSRLIPHGIELEPVFTEIKSMLQGEANYEIERSHMDFFRSKLATDPHFKVPKSYAQYSTSKILTTEFCSGDNIRENSLDQELRDHLGKAFLDLLFKEIFLWGLVQTDAHPGNYLLQINTWVLLDFGATKKLSPQIQNLYKVFMSSVFHNDLALFKQTLFQEGYIKEKQEFNQELLAEYFETIRTPFTGAIFDWGNSPIPEKMLKLLPLMLKEFSLHQPPAETLFIDRKIGGVFFILKILGSRFDARQVLETYIKN